MATAYSPETVDFLWGIRMNNNREWFQAHKQQYVDTLYEPTKALGAYLFQPFVEKSGTILKVSRIYRDARLHPPVPYKESLWICIRQDVQWWAENPCLFFEIDPDGVRYGFTLWRPSVATMEDFRQEITRRPEEFLSVMASVAEKVDIPVTAECYKRPKPTENAALAPYFAWKNDISCIHSQPFSEEVFGDGLKQAVAAMFQSLTPLYDYFTRFRV